MASTEQSFKFSPINTPELEDSVFNLVSGMVTSKCDRLRIGDVLYIQPTDPKDLSVLAGSNISLEPLLQDNSISADPEPKSLAELAPPIVQSELPPETKADEGPIVCEICECNPATIECLDCKHDAQLCDDCLASSHKGPSKRSHRTAKLQQRPVEPAVKSLPTEELKVESATPKCKAHPEDQRRFICRQCGVTVCSTCLIAGEHRGHDAIPFEKAAEYVRATYGAEMDKYVLTMARINKIREVVQRKKEKITENLVATKAEIEAWFAEAERLFQFRKAEVLESLDAEYKAKMSLPVKKIEDLLATCESSVSNTKSLLDESDKGTLTPDTYDSLVNANKVRQGDSETTMAGNIAATTQHFERISEVVAHPVFNLPMLRTTLAACVIVTADKPAAMGVLDVRRWRVVNGLQHTGWWAGLAQDPSTKQYFVVTNHTDNKIYMFSTLENLMKNRVCKTITLEKNRSGTYFAVSGGCIYYPVTTVGQAGQVAQADLSTGRTKAILSLPNAGKRNDKSSAFNWGGYTDIAPMTDPTTQMVYVMYQDIASKECKIGKVTQGQVGIELSEVKVLTGKKKYDFGFAIVNAGHVLLGRGYDKARIDCDFNLGTDKWEHEPNILLPGGFNYITCAISTEDRMVFLCDYNRGIFYVGPE